MAGTLDLPWLYDFSQLLIALMYLITGFTGTLFWGLPREFLFGYSFTEAMIYTVVVSGAWSLIFRQVNSIFVSGICDLTIYHSIYKIYAHRATQKVNRLSPWEVRR